MSEYVLRSAFRKRPPTLNACAPVTYEIDAFTFEPFGNVRHLHYRLSFRDDKVQANTYRVDVVREDGRWKVCQFFSLSRNPDKPGLLSDFENW